MIGRAIRLLAFLAAVALVVHGFVRIEDQGDRRWLLTLLATGVLLTIAWWPAGIRSLPVLNRTILRWSGILLVVFALVSIQLVRVQVIDAEKTANRVAPAPDGEVASNPRLYLATMEDERGKILDRNDVVLADTVEIEPNRYARTWPEASTGGLIGYYSPQMYGSTNLESALEPYLSGKEGGNVFEEFIDGVLHVQRPGYNTRLTIDVNLQREAAALLAGRPGGAVLMDPATGEILAMYGEPTFDPNQLYARSDRSSTEQDAAIQAYWTSLINDPNAPLVFRPTAGLYNPGSTFKSVTASALVDLGLARGDTVFRDEGVLDVDGRIIEEPNRPDNSRVDWSLEESFAWSLNVVFAQIGLQLGSEHLWDYGARFGFGTELPLEFDTAQSQVAQSLNDLHTRTLVADTGFGQGQILASPLQMALIVAAIENGGLIMEPHLLGAVVDSDGDVLETRGPAEWRRAISSGTAAIMRDLFLATADYGYSTGAQIEGMTVGGKTGTAEIETGEPHSWFIGFAEHNDRKVVVAVVVEHGGPGSVSALPIGRQLMQSALSQ